MCWQKHLPGASKKEDVCFNPVPVSACGTSFHDIIQNMMVAAQVPRNFTAMCLQADWHNVCEECGADWSIGRFAVILLTDVVYGVFFFFSFPSWSSCCFQVSWKLGIIFHEATDFHVNLFSPDRASGVREALQAEVEPQGEMVRMAKMGSLGCLVLPDCRWVCSLMMEDPHFFPLNLKC